MKLDAKLPVEHTFSTLQVGTLFVVKLVPDQVMMKTQEFSSVFNQYNPTATAMSGPKVGTAIRLLGDTKVVVVKLVDDTVELI